MRRANAGSPQEKHRYGQKLSGRTNSGTGPNALARLQKCLRVICCFAGLKAKDRSLRQLLQIDTVQELPKAAISKSTRLLSEAGLFMPIEAVHSVA